MAFSSALGLIQRLPQHLSKEEIFKNGHISIQSASMASADTGSSQGRASDGGRLGAADEPGDDDRVQAATPTWRPRHLGSGMSFASLFSSRACLACVCPHLAAGSLPRNPMNVGLHYCAVIILSSTDSSLVFHCWVIFLFSFQQFSLANF